MPSRSCALLIGLTACGDNAAGLDAGGAGPDTGAGDAAAIDAAIDAPPDARDAAPIASISASATALRAGEQAVVTVALDRPAPAGGQSIAIDVENITVLGAPSALYVEAGETSIELLVLAKRPSRPVSVTASAGGTSRSLAIGVTGLALVEVLAALPGADSGLEWIKISNSTDVGIELGDYTIGCGRTHYTYSLTQLTGLIPPHSCFLVGGPTSNASNGNPTYSQVFNFSPDLLAGSGAGGQATAFGLFDLPITAVTEGSVPIDAVLCGVHNRAGVVGADGLPATPHCPDVAIGHSVNRTGATTWVERAPEPTSCTPID